MPQWANTEEVADPGVQSPRREPKLFYEEIDDMDFKTDLADSTEQPGIRYLVATYLLCLLQFIILYFIYLYLLIHLSLKDLYEHFFRH